MTLTAVEPQGVDRFAEATQASTSQMADFHGYLALLTEWNGRMNLVGPSALREFWVRHALDSAQLFHVERQALRWADVGSGAGLPGIPLAILLKGAPGAEVHLFESIAKRVDFLRHVSDELRLPVQVHHNRVEAFAPLPWVDIVTARACAPLDKLLELTYGFFRSGARGLFLKGRNIAAEIEAAEMRWRIRYDLLASLSDPSGRLLHLKEVKRRDGR